MMYKYEQCQLSKRFSYHTSENHSTTEAERDLEITQSNPHGSEKGQLQQVAQRCVPQTELSIHKDGNSTSSLRSTPDVSPHVESRGRVTSLKLLTSLLLMQPRMLLAFFALRVHRWLTVSLSTPKSFSAELLSRRSAPQLYRLHFPPLILKHYLPYFLLSFFTLPSTSNVYHTLRKKMEHSVVRY